MATKSKIVKNYTWDDVSMREDYNWIKEGSERYLFLRSELINRFFPVLQSEDKNLLLISLVQVVNLIHTKFGFSNNNDKNENLLWDQLKQNNLLDLRALLAIMLPFISDNETDDKKRKLKKLEDLYLEVDERGMFVYTNSQYNRCIRHNEDGKIVIMNRPFLKEYFIDHVQLLLMSIETISNKMYVNWVDVLPVKMNEFVNTKLYKDTVEKFIGKIVTKPDGTIETKRDVSIQSVDIIHNYIDPLPGLSYQDFYNVMSNHLFHQIKNHKWLIYDMIIQKKPISYITYLETKFNLGPVWKGLLWSQTDKNDINTFTYQWNIFMDSFNADDNTVLHHFYFFFSKYHKNATKLIRQKKLLIDRNQTDMDEEEEENIPITPESTRNAKAGLANVPVEEIYLFFCDQLSSFKKSWYYYMTKIKKNEYLANENDIYITPKNIYNYCKSMVHYTTRQNEFIQIPRHWYSLKPKLIEMVLIRMLNIDSSEKNNWFNIKNYIRKFYTDADESELAGINTTIHSLIRTKIVDVVFESLIYHGLLSDFKPSKNITDNSVIESSINTTNDRQKTTYKHAQMKEKYFSGTNRKDYETNAYYFITGTTYGELDPLKSKDYYGYKKKYFDFLTSDQIWTFTYAMNWISQINFYHHYLNNRIMYVTGATGVGKSTQVPKLLMYSQKMLDYNSSGKIICTQPRVPPTVENADTISRELGVPVRAYDEVYDKSIFTSNYYVQYKHQKEEHVDRAVDSFLRIVTDGTLLEEVKNSPFLTRSVPDPYAIDTNGKRIKWAQTFSAGNNYDIVIVDEAHEHNPNMDMILTLVRDSVYVNNSLKLVIVSATMEDDEPIYRRYYRTVNDNRAYPLSAFIEDQNLDRANMDRRIHISPPGATTQYTIKDHYLSEKESNLINDKNFVDFGIKKTIEIVNSTTQGDILLFMTGQADIRKAVAELNANIPTNVIALGYYSELSEEVKTFIVKIHQTLSGYTRLKEDVLLEERDVIRRVSPGTYNRAIIIATNVAEASITLQNLKYVVDTGYAKVNVFDPIESTQKMITLPISQSSSMQRRGRVGRVGSGEVYYMYDKEKIINNKTAYKIADSDIKDLVVKLLKSDPGDSFIISQTNDINNIYNLQNIMEVASENVKYQDFIYNILKNPRPYLEIIKKQYMYIPDITDATQYYTYYGKTDGEDYETVADIKINFKQYILSNHDDYHYQKYTVFQSKSYTGYDDFILEDQKLDFYIIHPDENVIKRNLFTGAIESIKYNPAVGGSYYYYLLKSNNINIDDKSDVTVNFDKIDYENFALLKYPLAIDDAKLQLLIVDIPTKTMNMFIDYTNERNQYIKKHIRDYYLSIAPYFSNDKIVTVKSQILSKLSAIQAMSSVRILDSMNNLLWYSFAIPYGVENDVLALMTLIGTVSDISQWIGDVTSKRDIEKFFLTHITEKGDIYFLWQLWNNIKDVLNSKNIFDLTKIDVGLEIRFRNYKELYLKRNKTGSSNQSDRIPFNEFLLLDKMFKSGKLNVQDELYNYVSKVTIDFKEIIKTQGVTEYINIIAKNNRLNAEKIQDFLIAYFDVLFTLNKKVWLYQYEMKNKLNEQIDEEDVIEWAKSKLSLPGIINNPNYTPTTWDHILETYIRAFSTNLIKNEGGHYLRINKGVRMDPIYWAKRLILEKTFLNNKTDFIIYHNEESKFDSVSASYLTPVKLEWILELNPIYYYYFFFDKNNTIYLMRDDEDVIRAIEIINANRKFFNFKALIAYLDQIDNPIISDIVRNEMYRFQSK